MTDYFTRFLYRFPRIFFPLKFIFSEKATKFCEIFTLLLTNVHTVKSKVKISQNFVAFSEYMNFKGLSDLKKRGWIILLIMKKSCENLNFKPIISSQTALPSEL